MQVSMLKALLQVPSFLQWIVTSLSPVLGYPQFSLGQKYLMAVA